MDLYIDRAGHCGKAAALRPCAVGRRLDIRRPFRSPRSSDEDLQSPHLSKLILCSRCLCLLLVRSGGPDDVCEGLSTIPVHRVPEKLEALVDRGVHVVSTMPGTSRYVVT